MSNRINMFTNHIRQAIVLKEPEFPRVFTNFENQVGKYSSAYKKADRNWEVIKKIEKNEKNILYVLKDKNSEYYHIETIENAERTTEKYGYKMENKIEDKSEGDDIEKDDLIYRSTSYDDDLNFMYGTNLKALYIPWKNLTFEDAICISESAKEKLTSYRVDEITININTNDILINLYGDNNEYKSFPDIGESFNKFLCARRRIDYDSILTDLKTTQLNNINYSTDTVFYSDGEVIDISVYSNADTEKLEKHQFNQQLVKYIKSDEEHYQEVYDCLSEIVEGNDKENYSDDLAYQYKRAEEITDDEIVWRNNGKEFSNVIVKFKILKTLELNVGSKLSGRSGMNMLISL